MSNMMQIADQVRACNSDHVRAVIEPDDVMVLLDYLEGQGFLSSEGMEAKVYARFLKSKGVLPEHVQTQEEQDASKMEYEAFRVEHPDPVDALASIDTRREQFVPPSPFIANKEPIK